MQSYQFHVRVNFFNNLDTSGLELEVCQIYLHCMSKKKHKQIFINFYETVLFNTYSSGSGILLAGGALGSFRDFFERRGSFLGFFF